ncbi:MAG: hypothetical protein AAGC43_14900 [Bacteroidota bacterium]
MQLTIIIWTLVCAIIIIVYPIFLFGKSSRIDFSEKQDDLLPLDSINLFSFDLKDRPLGWSFTIEIPELTEEVLFDNTVLFYLETEETCIKLPVNNESLGYTANVFKNVGKIYLTFKCIKDGVSNYSAPMCHLKSLKVLVVGPKFLYPKNKSIYQNEKYTIYNILKASRVNIHNYEETLEYLSNFCEIEFKGYRKNRVSLLPKTQVVSKNPSDKSKYSALQI